jgi:hypothetical protein
MVKSSGGMNVLRKDQDNEYGPTIDMRQEKRCEIGCQTEYNSRETKREYWS